MSRPINQLPNKRDKILRARRKAAKGRGDMATVAQLDEELHQRNAEREANRLRSLMGPNTNPPRQTGRPKL